MATNDLTKLARRVWWSFLGRSVQRFLAITGFDRCLVLSSQAFTAVIPLLILATTLAPAGNEEAVTNAVIRRFGLEGDAAASVVELFRVPSEATGGVSLFSALLLVASGTSFMRRMQRMYRAAWGLEKAGARSGLYAALGLVVVLVEVAFLYGARSLGRNLPAGWALTVLVSVGAGLVFWTAIPYLLLDRRVHWRRLAAGGAVAALGTAAYAVATTVYMPALVQNYTSEFGLFGITIALIGWLLAIAAIVVGSAALGAEFDSCNAPWARAMKDRWGLTDPGAARVTPVAVEQEAGLTADDLLLLTRVLVDWLLLAVAVWGATLVPGISVPGGPLTYLTVSLLLGLLNALLTAVPILVDVPFASATVGTSALVLNALLLGLASLVTDKLEVDNVGAALLGGLVISVVATVLGMVRPTRPPRAQP